MEGVCKGFEDYAQAKYKASGEPTIIRLMTHEGNMNPLMSMVDMVPDEDLNTKLKFYVSILVHGVCDDIMGVVTVTLTSDHQTPDTASLTC